jgi:hypothetical protein
MKTKNILLILIVVVALVIVFYSSGDRNPSSYVEQIAKERSEKNSFMQSSPESPFSGGNRKFTGLNYFPPDAHYKVIADLIPIDSKKIVVLKTSDGKEDRYIDYAYAEFDLDGKRNRLLILEVATMGPSRGKLFLAFGDETSAQETYGAGRYLDVEKVPSRSISTRHTIHTALTTTLILVLSLRSRTSSRFRSRQVRKITNTKPARHEKRFTASVADDLQRTLRLHTIQSRSFRAHFFYCRA